MFCSNCGSPLNEGTKFCPNCGGAQNAAPAPAPAQPTFTPPVTPPVYQAPVYAGQGEVRKGIPAPGYSDRVNHPEILAAIKKSRKAAGIFAVILVPIPFIGFLIYSMVSDDINTEQGMLYGAILSGIFLLFALYSFIKERAKNTYEATVIRKRTREVHRHRDSDNDETMTEYITTVRTVDGRKKKIVETDRSQRWAWDYLREGDRFKYHPQFHFPYELYDKSRAPYIACVSCGNVNAVTEDRCEKCNLPLLK